MSQRSTVSGVGPIICPFQVPFLVVVVRTSCVLYIYRVTTNWNASTLQRLDKSQEREDVEVLNDNLESQVVDVACKREGPCLTKDGAQRH